MANIRNAPSESTDELFLTGLNQFQDEKHRTITCGINALSPLETYPIAEVDKSF